MPDDSPRAKSIKAMVIMGFGVIRWVSGPVCHCGLSSLSVVTGKLSPLVRTGPEWAFLQQRVTQQMTDHRRYSTNRLGPATRCRTSTGSRLPHAPGQAGHQQQPYDWRYATQAPQTQPTQRFRQPYDPYRGVGPHSPVGGPPVGPTVIPAPPRRRSRCQCAVRRRPGDRSRFGGRRRLAW